MTTIPTLIDEVDALLHNYTGIREQVTYLTQPLDSTATTLNVEHGTRISLGLIEIGDELMLVSEVEDAGVVQLFPDGRAEQGSTAAHHVLNTRVTNDPYFPRQHIRQAIQATLEHIRPELFRVKATSLAWSPTRLVYELPSDVDRVLEVRHQAPEPFKVWPVVSRWEYLRSAPASDFPSGKALAVKSGAIVSGRAIHVTYAAPHGTVVTGLETFAELGLQESLVDVLKYGSAWRLVQSGEVSRLLMQGVPQRAQQDAVPVAAATTLAKQFYAIYQERLGDERRRLLDLHPMQIHRT